MKKICSYCKNCFISNGTRPPKSYSTTRYLKTLRKTKGSINGYPFYKQLNQRVISATKTTVELSDGKIIRKSENLTLEVISLCHHFPSLILKYAQEDDHTKTSADKKNRPEDKPADKIGHFRHSTATQRY